MDTTTGKLKNILAQSDAVICIGYGISSSWTDLAHHLVTYLNTNGISATLTERELQRDDLPQALSYGMDILDPSQVAQILNDAATAIAPFPSIYEQIISLGASCYITTSYNNALATALQQWQPTQQYTHLTNRQLAHLGSITDPQARHFIYHLHGTPADAESLIITLQHYRTLQPGGNRHQALQAVHTLMATRPVLYLGYTLKDPDFLLLRDLIAATGNDRHKDHYAIMPDVPAEEQEYWLQQYGLHIITYPSASAEALPSLLQSLQPSGNAATADTTHHLRYALARYAQLYPPPAHTIPLQVRSVRPALTGIDNYYGWLAERLLSDGPGKLLLIGAPGTGKSHILRHSAAHLAGVLYHHCVNDTLTADTIIPIYVDMRLYTGNLADLVDRQLPAGLTFTRLCSQYKVKLYIDAFDQMPRVLAGPHLWMTDFTSFTTACDCSLVIAARVPDMLTDLNLPTFSIEHIEHDYVVSTMQQKGITLNEQHNTPLMQLLRIPLFYHLVISGQVPVSEATAPHNIYRYMVLSVARQYYSTFGTDTDLPAALAATAIQALEEYGGTFTLHMLQAHLPPADAAAITHWLVSRHLLTPLPGGRIAFMHPSLTLYLAATHVAAAYPANSGIAQSMLRSHAYNKVLCMALAMMAAADADRLFAHIRDASLALAIEALKYMPGDTIRLTDTILDEIITTAATHPQNELQLAMLTEHELSLTAHHIPALRRLLPLGDLWTSAAMAHLMRIDTASFMQEALDMLASNSADTGFCLGIAAALQRYITIAHIPAILGLSLRLHDTYHAGHNIYRIIGMLLSPLPVPDVMSAFFIPTIPLDQQQAQVAALKASLSFRHDDAALKIAAYLLANGVSGITYELFTMLSYWHGSKPVNYNIFTLQHVSILIQLTLEDENNGGHAISVLARICAARQDIADHVARQAAGHTGMRRIALLYAAYITTSPDTFYAALATLAGMPSPQLDTESLHLLHNMNLLNWMGREELLIALLYTRSYRLAMHLCQPLTMMLISEMPLCIDLTPADKWWLQWMADVAASGDVLATQANAIFPVIMRYVPKASGDMFVAEFNNEASPWRYVLARYALASLSFTIDQLTPGSIAYLLHNIETTDNYISAGDTLVNIATPRWVHDVLLPRYHRASGHARARLTQLIDVIGRMHDQRYLTDEEANANPSSITILLKNLFGKQ